MTTETRAGPEPKNVHEAKNAVMAEVGYCKKSRAAGLNYSFAGEAALIEALRPSMVEHGLTIAPIDCDLISAESYATKSGGSMRLCRTRHTFRLTHAPSGTSEDIKVFGEAADAGDKCLAKCQTIAYKYALRQAFEIETGDDPDKYPSEEAEPPPRQQQPPHQQRSPQGPPANGSVGNQPNRQDGNRFPNVLTAGPDGALVNGKPLQAQAVVESEPWKRYVAWLAKEFAGDHTLLGEMKRQTKAMAPSLKEEFGVETLDQLKACDNEQAFHQLVHAIRAKAYATKKADVDAALDGNMASQPNQQPLDEGRIK